MVADGHHRHDLARVEKQRQRPFLDHRCLDAAAFMIETRHGLEQAHIFRRRSHREFGKLV